MAVQIGVDIRGKREIYAAFERLLKVGGNLKRPLRLSALERKRAAQRKLRARRSRWGPSRGILARSLTERIDEMGYVVGSALPYAAVQQVGHPNITPKTAKLLAIPMLPHLRRNGIWPRDLPRGSMRYVPIGRKGVVAKLVRATDTDISAERKKKGAKGPRSTPKQKVGETMYLLVESVRIPERPYIGWDAEAERFLLQALQKEYAMAIARR